MVLNGQCVLAAVVLAQSADPISGGAGWVGAGLLGLVLGWLLLVHLPAKDRQLKELLQGKDEQFQLIVKSKDEQVARLLAQKWEMIQALTKDYKDGIKDVAGHCEQEIARLTTYWQSQMGSLTTAIQDLAEKIDGMPRHQA